MALLNITPLNPDDLDAPSEFPVLSSGKHLFVVAKPLEIRETSGNSPKNMFTLEARCQDDDENKGIPVFENFLIISHPISDKETISKKINDAKLAQFVASTGMKTMEQLKAGEQFDLNDLFEKNFQAETKIVMEDAYPEELDENGKNKKVRRSRIKAFLYK